MILLSNDLSRSGCTKPMAVLDRDGVLNIDTGYVHRSEQFAWVDGAIPALVLLTQAGYRITVATNQSGIARGMYTEGDVLKLHEWMASEIAVSGAKIDGFYYCPYHPQASIDRYRSEHPDRKPAPGMIKRALADYPTDLARSFLIGDRDTDVEAAKAAGLLGFLFEGGSLHLFVMSILARINSI